MYKFAYLYVRLGYILAGIVFGVSIVFFGGTLVVLEFQKPRASSEDFNADLARIQGTIKAQVASIRDTFGLDPQTPALKQLSERSWQTSYVSLASANRLRSERQAALQECEELRSDILAKLETDIRFILGKLDASPLTNLGTSDGDTDSEKSSSQLLPEQTQTQLYAQGAALMEKIAQCHSAEQAVISILGETKNSENRSALERARGEIIRFLAILRSEQGKVPENPAASSPFEPELGSSAAPASEPSRRDNARALLVSVLYQVKSAVTGEWALAQTLEDRLGNVLTKFEDRANANNVQSDGLLRSQLEAIKNLLLFVMVAFFIAVGSDLVRAIIDSAVWLSHIYTNTSAKSRTDETEHDR
jgi:hypothetical protein